MGLVLHCLIIQEAYALSNIAKKGDKDHNNFMSGSLIQLSEQTSENAINKDKDYKKVQKRLPLKSEWLIVNDSVMGGVSESHLVFDDKIQALIFSGKLSLDNNGGFVSVRREVPNNFFSLSTYICVGFELNARRTLQIRLRNNSTFDGVAYVSEVSGTGELSYVKLPIEQFRPRFRGWDLSNDPRVSTVINSLDIAQFGFLIGDKNTSPFQLKIHSILACDHD
ncbi:MAG: CIA30 family protein [Gammaproteobacteria bacterium]|nr:CIA30 family protein [Gammaproteobacteria bacterium]